MGYYSAEVRLWIEVGGRRYRCAAVGPDVVRVKEDCSLPPSSGFVCVEVNGEIDSYKATFPDGVCKGRIQWNRTDALSGHGGPLGRGTDDLHRQHSHSETKRHHMYVIYDHPLDYPDEYVCRGAWFNAGVMAFDAELFARASSLEELRSQLPGGLVCFPRQDGDDPVIVETWM